MTDRNGALDIVNRVVDDKSYLESSIILICITTLAQINEKSKN